MRSDIVFSGASFRDPSGMIYYYKGVLLRQINLVYQPHYDHLIDSGLFNCLVTEGLLIPHTEVAVTTAIEPNKSYKVIQPEIVPFISYPYERCFSQLKDDALLTLRLQKKALDFGMSLKDASAYNIQRFNGKPVLIDSLSFERYIEGQPWTAYRQFCQHFLAPLALMSLRDIRLHNLLFFYLDGIPLDLANLLLPWKSYLNFSILTHIRWHAKIQKKHASDSKQNQKCFMSRYSLLALIDHLQSTIANLRWEALDTEWAEYYDHTNYTEEAWNTKKNTIESFIELVSPKTVWDLGANTGFFSRLSSMKNIMTIAFDKDPAAVEKNYRLAVSRKESFLYPLVIDLANPSPSQGWAHGETTSITARGPADLVLALALIHHLAISNNLPLKKISDYLRTIGKWLVIEFISKDDSQVQRLLRYREDIFTNYSEAEFEWAFSNHFEIIKKIPLPNSKRTLYLMKRK